jgi:hypothetical protein
VIRAHLTGEVATGLIAVDEYARLCSVRGRLHALAAAFHYGGLRAWLARRACHRAASELAFLRRRATVDGLPVDASLEAVYREQLGAAGRSQDCPS